MGRNRRPDLRLSRRVPRRRSTGAGHESNGRSTIVGWFGFRHDNRNTGAYGTDTISPGPVRDLSATSLPLSGTALHWTAPGGDGFCGKADHYEIRASSAPITGDNWDSAQLLGVMPAAAVGSQESFPIAPSLSGTYYVSVRAID